MITATTVADLEGLLDGTSITTLTLSTPTETITLRRHADAVVAAPEPSPSVATSPCSGAFLHRHPLRDAPFVQPGQPVQAGTVLGLIQVGPLLLHVAAPRAGTVTAMFTPEGALVGYGAELVRMDAA